MFMPVTGHRCGKIDLGVYSFSMVRLSLALAPFRHECAAYDPRQVGEFVETTRRPVVRDQASFESQWADCF